jgi:quercetin dioxygenase-like cupin family protein
VITALLKLVPAAVMPLNVLGDQVLLKPTSQNTNAQFSPIEQFNKPGTGLPKHLPTREDEMLMVLEGAVEFIVGEMTTVVEADGIVCAPRHGIQLPGSEHHSGQNALLSLARGVGKHVLGVESAAQWPS